MSEAEKTASVEDVLSSIRRLVANRTNAAPVTANQVDDAEQAAEPAEEAVEQKSVPEQEPANDPVSFVDTMNASIAEITQNTETGPGDVDPVSDPIMPVNHMDNYSGNATEEQPEAPEPVATVTVETVSDKQATLVLRPEMAADPKTAEAQAKNTDEAELVLSDTDDAQAEYEASFQDIPEDDVTEIVMPEIVEDDRAASDSDPDADDLADAQFIDEDALREIVSALVRAELQGDLGDRITRNVRKLVRREIHHALATRDIE